MIALCHFARQRLAVLDRDIEGRIGGQCRVEIGRGGGAIVLLPARHAAIVQGQRQPAVTRQSLIVIGDRGVEIAFQLMRHATMQIEGRLRLPSNGFVIVGDGAIVG